MLVQTKPSVIGTAGETEETNNLLLSRNVPKHFIRIFLTSSFI